MKILLVIPAMLIAFGILNISGNKNIDKPIIKSPNDNPKELGNVNWLRNYDEAVSKAKELNKPVLILFQEVPGCATCVGYGEQVLSHPLLVEAIENNFIPVAIFNNKGGEDLKVLKKYNEPSWNNPVVRIVNENGKDIISRVNADYSLLGITTAMINALKKSGKDIPLYLKLLKDEFTAYENGTETAVFAMSCFWTGESVLGSIDGVVSTQPGFKDGYEVVKVKYNPDVISYDKLKSLAEKQKCAIKSFNNDKIRNDHQPKYYLSHTDLKYVPMTEIQACRINSAIAKGNDYKIYLSPKQIKLLDYINKNPDKSWSSFIGSENLKENWKEVTKNIL